MPFIIISLPWPKCAMFNKRGASASSFFITEVVGGLDEKLSVLGGAFNKEVLADPVILDGNTDRVDD